MKILRTMLMAILVLVPTVAFAEYQPICVEPTIDNPCPTETLEFEEESSCSGGDVCSDGYSTCMEACGARFGYMRYHNDGWVGLSSCWVNYGTVRRTTCFYS
jgi:hypothetical protein